MLLHRQEVCSSRQFYTELELAWKLIGILGLIIICSNIVSASCAEIEAQSRQFDAKTVIESLANRNPAPKLIGQADELKPVFDEKFDWAEQDRVQKAIKLLVEDAEKAWPELVSHLGDKRYAITYRLPTFETAINYSIGDICEQIISDAISQGYYEHLPRRSRASMEAYELASEPLPRKEGKLKSWCEKRSQRHLYELQIEMCNWVLEKIPELTKATEEERQAAVDAIRGQIKTLEATKKPVHIGKFLRSWKTVLYTKDSAEKSKGK